MIKEMKEMFDNEVIEKVPRQEMLDYCKALKTRKIDTKRQQLMFIWRFKRKKCPDGSLNKYKVRLCCHGGH